MISKPFQLFLLDPKLSNILDLSSTLQALHTACQRVVLRAINIIQGGMAGQGVGLKGDKHSPSNLYIYTYI